MNLDDYLKSLGSTADEVAATLRRQKIKGLVKSPCSCPILNAIYTEVHPRPWAGMMIQGGKAGGVVSYSATYDDAQIMDPSLPQAVMEFMAAFDSGAYPDLVAQKVREVTMTTRVWE